MNIFHFQHSFKDEHFVFWTFKDEHFAFWTFEDKHFAFWTLNYEHSAFWTLNDEHSAFWTFKPFSIEMKINFAWFFFFHDNIQLSLHVQSRKIFYKFDESKLGIAVPVNWHISSGTLTRIANYPCQNICVNTSIYWTCNGAFKRHLFVTSFFSVSINFHMITSLSVWKYSVRHGQKMSLNYNIIYIII